MKKKFEFAIFLSLDGKAAQAIAFYQKIFGADLLFKITNQEMKEQMDTAIIVPKENTHYISHSVLQIGQTQLQITDNPVLDHIPIKYGNTVSFSILTENTNAAQALFEKASEYPQVQVIQEPIENIFAHFYAVIKDPFGILIQITHEKEMDPTIKGEKINETL